jgi:hypothetical protein
MTGKTIRLIEHSHNAAHWAPTDVLCEMDERLEKGTKPKCLLIAYIDEQDNINYIWGGTSGLQRIGLVSILQQRFCNEY